MQGRIGHSGNASLVAVAFSDSHTKYEKWASWIFLYGMSQGPFDPSLPLRIFTQCLCGLYKSYCHGGFLASVRPCVSRAGCTGRKIPWSNDFLDGFLFDRSYTTRSGWRLFVWNDLLSFWCASMVAILVLCLL
jgi:hypothetical protein